MALARQEGQVSKIRTRKRNHHFISESWNLLLMLGFRFENLVRMLKMYGLYIHSSASL